MIPTSLLEDYKAIVKHYEKDDIIFQEQEAARFYYQIKTGNVQMYNLTEDGKMFHVMVMDMLGKSLEDLFQECRRKFDLQSGRRFVGGIPNRKRIKKL